jgi:hypothetical protein
MNLIGKNVVSLEKFIYFCSIFRNNLVFYKFLYDEKVIFDAGFSWRFCSWDGTDK